MRSIRAVFLGLMSLLIAASFTGCAEPPKAEPTPPEIEAALPVVRTIVDYEEFTGRLDAIDSVQIKARVNGYIDAILFKEGDEVKEGDVLIQIDPRPYKAQMDQDQADLTSKKAVLVQKDLVLKRVTVLLGKKAITPEEYESDKADFEVARAAVGQAEAKLEISRLNYRWTKVKARVSGRVSRAILTRGNLVAADNTLLTTIVSIDPIWLYFTVDERTLLRLRRADQAYGAASNSEKPVIPVEMGLANEVGYSLKGTLNFEDNKVDVGTGTILMRAVFANPKNQHGVRLLSPGLFARVRVTVGNPRSGILVADRALGSDQGKKYLYVVADKTDPKTNQVQKIVERRYVQVGDLHDGLREIKTETATGALPAKQTVTAKDEVAVSGLQRIRAGTAVTPKLIDMPTAAPKGKGPPGRK